MQVKKRKKNFSTKGKPSLIVLMKSHLIKSLILKSIQRAIRSKDNSSFTKTKSEKDKLGFLHESFNYSINTKSGVYLHAAF
jgi:hypothetical protein